MTRVMQVLEASAGGTLRHVLEVSRGCRQRGLNIHVVCATRREPSCAPLLSELRTTNVEVTELDMRREISPVADLRAAIELRALIRRAAPDVLHLHSSKAGAIGRVAVATLGSRSPVTLYTPHAYAFLSQPGALNRWIYRSAERVLTSWTDLLVAVSESEANAARALGGCDRVAVICNGADAAARNDSAASGPIRIGWLGRFFWQKNPEAALTVSSVLSQLGMDHELLLGGTGPLQRSVDDAIARLDVGKRVRLLSPVQDVSGFYRGIDVLLMTSRHEGLPYSGLDAMAHAVPIVAFDVDGISDLVRHGATGLLAPRDDAGALAAHIARLARDPALRQALGLAARERLRAAFSASAQLDQLCDLYHSLALSRAGRLIQQQTCFHSSSTHRSLAD